LDARVHLCSPGMPANIFHPLETVVTSEGMTPYQQGRFAIGFDAAQSGHAWQEGKGGRACRPQEKQRHGFLLTAIDRATRGADHC